MLFFLSSKLIKFFICILAQIPATRTKTELPRHALGKRGRHTFSLFLHENVCLVYSFGAPRRKAAYVSTYLFIKQNNKLETILILLKKTAYPKLWNNLYFILCMGKLILHYFTLKALSKFAADDIQIFERKRKSEKIKT